MRIISGIADADKIASVNSPNYEVTVTDGHGLVILSIGGMTYPAGLTPLRARQIARCLRASAKRIADAKAAASRGSKK